MCEAWWPRGSWRDPSAWISPLPISGQGVDEGVSKKANVNPNQHVADAGRLGRPSRGRGPHLRLGDWLIACVGQPFTCRRGGAAGIHDLYLDQPTVVQMQHHLSQIVERSANVLVQMRAPSVFHHGDGIAALLHADEDATLDTVEGDDRAFPNPGGGGDAD